MHNDPIIENICKELVALRAAHTILLYGSRSDGTAAADSDYDIAAFATIDKPLQIARHVAGAYLDVFIYPEPILLKPNEEHLKLRGSHVLLQRGTEAQDFLSRLEDVFNLGPGPLPADEIAMRKAWAHKMLVRLQRADDEGNYRRVWLLTALLEDYFHIRSLWYLGPKKSLRWLQQHDAGTFVAMQLALKPNASVESITALVQLVAGQLEV